MMGKGMEEGRFSQRPTVVPGSGEAASLLKSAYGGIERDGGMC